MDPGFEATIKQEIPELPECPSDFDLNVLVEIDSIDLKPPAPHIQQQQQQSPLEIGSKNSAFQPYKPLTILTNLQRGNVKTLGRDAAPSQPLTFQEKAAKGSLLDTDINDKNVNSLDSDGLTALMWASFHGKVCIAEMLVNKGVDVNMTGPDGQTSLMFSAAKGHVDVSNYLLSSGAELEAEDEFGNTALMHAAHYNQPACVSELLIHGASMTKPNFIGDTAFDIAFKKGHRATQHAMEMHLKKILEANME
ncbi:ankyrin repeat family A protein 2 [Folsomia candida]|uniref:ankyrin repeat family A protein 2 n=1 Tax=Folsomia candida TaxID=158441 RepID=UPI000B8EEC82|nr:ankyrin repeat family A protein 2 [Folsomia candida]